MGTLAIFGAGGHGRVVADCAVSAGWKTIHFFDDGVASGTRSGPWLVIGSGADLEDAIAQYDGFVVALGDNPKRLGWHSRLEAAGGKSVTLIHPRATVSGHAMLGSGSVVFAGAVVNIGATIGTAAIINTGATVDHDCRLADGVHISPGAHLAGTVSVGRLSWVGVGAVVRESLVLGAGCVVGGGAVVVKSVADGDTVVGNPATKITLRKS